MTRKERKILAIKKRSEIQLKLLEIMQDEMKKSNNFTKACDECDRKINDMITETPQDKELILQTAYEFRDILKKEFEKVR